ncbi:MAG: dihydropteroate synthase [Candidatus Geothermincolia bacterium]
MPVPDGQAPETGSRFNPRLMRVEGEADARRLLRELGTDDAGAVIMSRKMVHAAIIVENVQARAANVIKQVMLSKGGECATPRDTLLKSDEPVSIIMIGTSKQLSAAVKNLSVQPFGLKALSIELKALMADSFGREPSVRFIPVGDRSLEVGGRTLVMGIVNVTPDSFSDGGQFYDLEAARLHALEMAAAGADIIDIGGESTRPGADPVTAEEEERRTVPLIESLAAEIDVPISIDTYKASIAEKALDAGASIVNDVSALRMDGDLAPLIAQRRVPVIIMHMQGEPRNMQENPTYDDVVGDISRFLLERAAYAVELGVDEGSIMIDPGIGFGKTVEHNLEILRRLEELRSLGYPVVLGTSRKRFIGSVLGRDVGDRTMGTAATVAFAIARGVDIVRVHDVREMIEVVKMADAAAGKWGLPQW